jgi:hypothetical protein
MRATLQKGQAKQGEEKHDDREFDVENSLHIDPDKVEDDMFWTYADTEEEHVPHDTAVLNAYESLYKDTLKRINDNYVKDRHPEKQSSMEEYLAKHRPEASILQIGNCLDEVDEDTLIECVQDYMSWEEEWSEAHGNPFMNLTLAMHVDETTPHVHTMKAWIAKDKYGNNIPNREKALEQAGIELPNPDKKVSRYNNRNMTFTAMCRDKWLDICEEHGLDIIREPIKGVKHKDKGNFIREREKDYQERSEALRAAQEAEIEVEVQNHADAYAIASISLIQDDIAKVLDARGKKLDDKKEELVETVQLVLCHEDNASLLCEDAKKYADKYANMGNNERASLMGEFLQGFSINGKNAYEVFCEREPQLKEARDQRNYEFQQNADRLLRSIQSRNREHDYDFMDL